MTQWHRSTYQDSDGNPVMFYYREDRAGWTIDRLQCGNGSRTTWYEYQVYHNGEKVGENRHGLLRNAKKTVDKRGAQ